MPHVNISTVPYSFPAADVPKEPQLHRRKRNSALSKNKRQNFPISCKVVQKNITWVIGVLEFLFAVFTLYIRVTSWAREKKLHI